MLLTLFIIFISKYVSDVVSVLLSLSTLISEQKLTLTLSLPLYKKGAYINGKLFFEQPHWYTEIVQAKCCTAPHPLKADPPPPGKDMG